jgi:hypothetical protein
LPPLTVPNCSGLTCTPGELSRFSHAETPTADGTAALELQSTRYFWPSH